MSAEEETETAPAAPEIERWRVPGSAGELTVLAAGEGGLPLLFIHGLAGRAEQWLPLLHLLAPQRRAAAVTLRGHGSSGFRAGSALGPEALADDVEAAADALGLGAFTLVGHSLGGAVAIAAAARSPQRIAGLLLVDPNGDLSRAPEAEVEAYLEAVRADPAGEIGFQFRQLLLGARPEVAEVILADLATVAPAVLLGALEGAARFPSSRRLALFPGPKLSLITPVNDLPVSLHKLVPELPASLLLGTSHWPMLDRPEEVAGAVESFLARVEPGPG